MLPELLHDLLTMIDYSIHRGNIEIKSELNALKKKRTGGCSAKPKKKTAEFSSPHDERFLEPPRSHH
jgi:hypothetical protein